MRFESEAIARAASLRGAGSGGSVLADDSLLIASTSGLVTPERSQAIVAAVLEGLGGPEGLGLPNGRDFETLVAMLAQGFLNDEGSATILEAILAEFPGLDRPQLVYMSELSRLILSGLFSGSSDEQIEHAVLSRFPDADPQTVRRLIENARSAMQETILFAGRPPGGSLEAAVLDEVFDDESFGAAPADWASIPGYDLDFLLPFGDESMGEPPVELDGEMLESIETWNHGDSASDLVAAVLTTAVLTGLRQESDRPTTKRRRRSKPRLEHAISPPTPSP